MQLSLLLDALPEKETYGFAEREVAGICYDSRSLKPGELFVAVPGFHVDGHSYLTDALRRGAGAVVVQRSWYEAQGGDLPPALGDVPLTVVPDSRRALARLAACFHGYPARKLGVVGVTGTDGKTTTCYLISAVLEAAGYKTGLLGTVDFRVGERSWSNTSRQTTPEAPEVQALLGQMVEAGVAFAVVESTSHGLALHRVADCEYDLAVFTNLSDDHLDFHQTRQRYRADKAKLFRYLGESVDKGVPKRGIVNLDDDEASYMSRACPRPVVGYGLSEEAEVRGEDVEATATGSRFLLRTPSGKTPVGLSLPARYNVYNALAAAAVGQALGLELGAIRRGLEAVEGVSGRMERVDAGQPFAVVVDYAHTPASLEKVLAELRPLTEGRLWVVFGCAGERDRGRREGMGRVAGRQADFAVLTNEDPRSEDENAILAEIAAGLESQGRREGEDYARVADRREAIAYAFSRARAGDLVLLAGKGHEQSIIVGRESLPWDDRAVARELLAGL